MKRPIVIACAAAMVAATPAPAQDAYMSPMDFSAQTQALTSSAIGNISVGEAARRGGVAVRNGSRGGGAATHDSGAGYRMRGCRS